MEYEILEDDNSENLCAKVKAMIEDGWSPQGGVSVAAYKVEIEGKGYSEDRMIYAQAMSKN